MESKRIIGQTKHEVTGQIINQVESNAIFVLIAAIIKHFMGHSFDQAHAHKGLLMNFKCPILSHFRWHKKFFLSKLMSKDDA